MKFLSVVCAGIVLAIAMPSRGGERSTAAPPATTRHYVGLTAPSQHAEIAPEQSGTIVLMPVAEGDFVKQGQIVLELSSRLQELEVARLHALAESDLPLRQARSALEHAQSEETRSRQLTEKQIGSDSELQDRQLETLLAQLKLGQAELARAQLINEWQQAKERLDQRTLRSPLAGIVTQWFAQPGETAEKLVPVLEVISLDPLWVEFECPVSEQNLFPIGAKVLVSPATRPGETRSAEILYLSMKANPSSHTFLVRAATSNQDYSWKAGLKMFVRLPDGTGGGAAGDTEIRNPSAPAGK